MTEQERGCEHCAYKYDQEKGKTLDTLKKTGIRHCFFLGISFREGMIVDCDNWKTKDIYAQFKQNLHNAKQVEPEPSVPSLPLYKRIFKKGE